MMWVRFPNGQCVQYNTATYANRRTEYTDLYTKKDGTWIAQVPNTCLIESVQACRVWNELDRTTTIQPEIAKQLRSIRRAMGRGKK